MASASASLCVCMRGGTFLCKRWLRPRLELSCWEQLGHHRHVPGCTVTLFFQAQTSQRSLCSCWMLSYIAFLPSVTLAVYTFTVCGAKGGCGASSRLCQTSTIPCPFAAWPAPAESNGPRGAQLIPFQGVGETSVLTPNSLLSFPFCQGALFYVWSCSPLVSQSLFLGHAFC